MAYYDNVTNQTVRFETRQCEEYPAWDVIDCGCCGGIRWGGESPEECDHCGGGGIIYRHRVSGATALWPGGPFTGKR